MYLTAVNCQEPATEEPDPFGDVREGVPLDQSVRGIAERLDPSGFLWVCQKMIPRTKVGTTSPLPAPARPRPPPRRRSGVRTPTHTPSHANFGPVCHPAAEHLARIPTEATFKKRDPAIAAAHEELQRLVNKQS
jgi:hypothetical protein